MGFIKKAVKVAKVVTSTDISSSPTSCQGCGKPVKSRKSSFCSNKCAEFYTVAKWGSSNY